MVNRHRATEPHENTIPASQRDAPFTDVRKTTLYIPAALHAEAKESALVEEMSLNAFVIEAIEHRIAGAKPTPTGATQAPNGLAKAGPGYVPESRKLLAIVNTLAKRLKRVEHALGSQDPKQPTVTVRRQRRLTVTEVRDLVRTILIERGSPMPHRMLLEHLLYEREVNLPGKNISENLRTILVHPKSHGFILLKTRGYWLDNSAAPVRK